MNYFSMIPLIFMTLAIFIAYISEFPILNTDPGVTPDVRYLSPVYLPLNLIGLLILSKFPNIIQTAQYLIKCAITFFCLLMPFFIVGIFLNARHNNQFSYISSSLSIWVLILEICIGVIIALFFYIPNIQNRTGPLLSLIALIVVIPLLWNR